MFYTTHYSLLVNLNITNVEIAFYYFDSITSDNIERETMMMVKAIYVGKQ